MTVRPYFVYLSLCDAPERDMRMRIDAASACLYDDLLLKDRYVGLLPDGINMALVKSDSRALFMKTTPHSFGNGWVADVLIAAYRDALLPLTAPINGPGIRNLWTTRSRNDFNEVVAAAITAAAADAEAAAAEADAEAAAGQTQTQAEHRKGAYYSTLVRHVTKSCADNLQQCSPFESERAARLGHLADYTRVHVDALAWLRKHRPCVADEVQHHLHGMALCAS